MARASRGREVRHATSHLEHRDQSREEQGDEPCIEVGHRRGEERECTVLVGILKYLVLMLVSEKHFLMQLCDMACHLRMLLPLSGL